MPKASSRILASGARQLVVQEALETMRCSGLSSPSLTPMTMVASIASLAGTVRITLLGAAGEVALELLALAEDAGRLDHHVDAELAPGDRGGVALGGHRDPPAVDVERLVVAADLALEDPHDGVVLQQIGELLVLEEVVDRRHLDVVAVGEDAEDAAADAAEAVDADPDRHHAASRSSSTKRRDQVDDAVGVAPAVVVPGERLRHPLAEHHRRLRVEGARVGAAQRCRRRRSARPRSRGCRASGRSRRRCGRPR